MDAVFIIDKRQKEVSLTGMVVCRKEFKTFRRTYTERECPSFLSFCLKILPMEQVKRWVLDSVQGGYEFEVYIEVKDKLTLESAEEKLETLLRAKEGGVGIRVFKEGRMGFAYTSELTENSVKECVLRAMEICQLTPPDEGFKLLSGQNYGTLHTYDDQEGFDVSVEEKIELLLSLERRAKELDSRVKGVRKVSLKQVRAHVYCFNSCGLEYNYESTWYTSLMALVAEEGGDSNIAYEWTGSRSFKKLDLEGMVNEAVFKATALLKPEPVETKVMPVVLHSSASAMLLEAFSPVFLGENLVKNKTFLKGMEGQRVFSELLSITDDGSLPEGFSSLPVDAEGNKTRENRLVERGIFKGFLHNTYSAIKSGSEPTGNSVRDGFRSLPSCGITNLYIHPGEQSLEELLSAEEEVFFITDLMGLHTVDPISGSFSLGAGGIIYKGGRKHKPVRGVVIGGSIQELWGMVEGVGKDFKFYANVGSPSMYVKRLTIGG